MNKEQKEKIAEAAIDYIRLRTSDGFDQNGTKFKRYSKKYADKKGVGVNDVDLIFDGDMLMGIEVTGIGSDYVEIGYKDDSEQAGKAEGNILGTYGQQEPVVKGGRKFLGIKKDEIDIFKEALDEDEISDDDIEQAAIEAAIEILGDIEFE
jgi:hypothetical protein